MFKRVPHCLAALILLVSSVVPTIHAEEGARILAGNPVSIPLRWSGYWLTQVDKGYEACTAQFITNRIVLLAAHCVRDQDTGRYYDPQNRNTIFLLQYQNDSFSKLYRPLCKFVFNDWIVPLGPGEDPNKPDTMNAERRKAYLQAKNNAWQFDFALVYLDADSITGHYNLHVNERWDGATSTGYPHNMMGGAVIQRISGDILPAADVAFSEGKIPNEQVLWHGNRDYTQGSSGGAWVVNFSSEEGPNTNIIVGLNSFDASDKPGASFGPFFNDNFTALLKFTEARCQPH